MKSLNDESLLLICVSPSSLLWSLVVEHVSHRHEPISLCTLNVHTENTRGNHHPNLRESSEREVLILRNLVTDVVIVSLYVFNLLFNLFEEWRSFQFLLVFLSEEDWEVFEGLGKNVNERMEEASCPLCLFLKDISSQEGVFGTK